MQIYIRLADPVLPPRWRNRAPDDWIHERLLHMTETIHHRLQRVLAAPRRAGVIGRFFYQRKPPGLRWRFLVRDSGAAEAVLAPLLENLQVRGLIRGAQRVIYEPEMFLLGGAAALRAVQDYADADASAWSDLVALRRRGVLPWATTLLSYAQCCELFARALHGCPEEIWDVWCRLAHFHGVAPAGAAGPRIRPAPCGLPGVTDDTRAALQALQAANTTLAARLDALHYDGSLQQGLRDVLAMIALLHWNRLGVTPAQRRQMLRSALTAWFPYDFAGATARASRATFRPSPSSRIGASTP